MLLTDVLDHLGIEYRRAGEHHHVRGNFVGVECFQCSPGSGKFMMGIPANGYVAVCWQCGKVGLAWALAQCSGAPYAKVKELLGGLDRGGAPGGFRPRGKLELPPGLGPLLKPHRDYLAGRGVDPDEARALWGVQGTGVAGRLSWRLFLPATLRGKTVSWTTRALHDGGPRYVSARPGQEAVPIKHTLFGLDLAGQAALVVEGPLDAMKIGPGAVALFGLKYTPQQVSLLGNCPVRLVCLDSEPAAQRAARRLCGELSCWPGVTRLVRIRSKDPGSAGEGEIKELRRMLT